MTHVPPFISKRALGDVLQRLRGEAGMSVVDVAQGLEVDRDTVRRWETGAHVPKRSALEHLGRLYGASSEEIRHLTKLMRDSKRPGLFEGNDVPPQMRQLYESESTADAIHCLELALIPGLLQTSSYQRAIQEAGLPVADELASVARRVRERRQTEVFGLEKMPAMSFLVAAGAIDNIRNLPQVRNDQHRRLCEAASLPTVEINVLSTLHAGMVGSFTIIKPAGGIARPFAYVEAVDGGRYSEDREVVSTYQATFDAARKSATPLEDYLQ